jgi:magnesium-protoporphyrin O-methyltransferase
LSDCCAPAYGKVFGARAARRAARRYRRKGLDAVGRWIVDDVRLRGVDRATVLELGGGIGSLQLELLRSGAASAVNVELSPEWEEAAAGLAREHGLDGVIERRIADAVEDADALAAADVVVMNRVVCCYPDPDALMGVAAERARRVLVVSFPHDRGLVRLWVRVANIWLRLRGVAFRSFVHSERRIEAAAERHGLRQTSERRGFIWRAVAFTRA